GVTAAGERLRLPESQAPRLEALDGCWAEELDERQARLDGALTEAGLRRDGRHVRTQHEHALEGAGFLEGRHVRAGEVLGGGQLQELQVGEVAHDRRYFVAFGEVASVDEGRDGAP